MAFGYRLKIGLPNPEDSVAIWGRKPVSKRGRRVARWRKTPLISFEDGFLRSVQTGRQGEASLSLIADTVGIYFETAQENQLRQMIFETDTATRDELQCAADGIDMLRRNHLSKYNDYPLSAPDLPHEFVLVIDQTLNDASVIGSGANRATFAQMLRDACADHPDLPIVIKTHPETRANTREGYFSAQDKGRDILLFTAAVSPWHLFERAKSVYVVSSQLGLEAIFAGHKPVVYGNAFYCGWGLSHDRHPDSKHHAERSSVQLFHATHQQYTRWYDPFHGCETDFEGVAQTLKVQADARRHASVPIICHGMRLWKRGFLKAYLAGPAGPPHFIENEKKAVAKAVETGGKIAVWAGKETANLRRKAAAAKVPILRVEDGFLRSAGLGAELVRPVSLAFDDLGIYYDPTSESRLERLISDAPDLPEYELQRAEGLRQKIIATGLSKYNLGGEVREIKAKAGQKIILIPGQVEDDASIKTGTDKISTNIALIAATRALFPNDFLIYKPHPDVEKGLRNGKVIGQTAADLILPNANISALLDRVDIVATMTSLTGFEALLRHKKVVCFGAPFYAGWGLTQDHGTPPKRREARPTLAGLIHATLIGYPRYWDPVTGKPCPVETVQKRLAKGESGGGSGRSIRLLAKAQGLLASYAHLWR